MLNIFRYIAMTVAVCLPLAGVASSSNGPAVPAGAAGTPPNAACPSTLQYQFPRLQDEKPQSLCQYTGKVLLVVNTASYCGYTPQYQGLEALYAKYKNRGLVVLGFPSNDFEQETGNNRQIADFCENTYGVKFPMFGKTSVHGPEANALYRRLAKATGQEPAWNFHKYLVARDGRVLAAYPSKVTPDDPTLVREIEKQLAAR